MCRRWGQYPAKKTIWGGHNMKGIIEKFKALNSYEVKEKGKLPMAEGWFLLFFTGAVIGWIYELFFYAITEDRFSNNGFLYGPYLPIYGFGALLMVLATKRFKKHPLAVFLITVPVTGVLEYVSGYLMWEIWHTRWWDYRGLFLNLDGYICFRSLLTFAKSAPRSFL